MEIVHRPRRLRRKSNIRRLMAETRLEVRDFVFPLFVTHGSSVREEIPSMPGQARLSVDLLPAEAEEIAALGIPAVLLFGLPEQKDSLGSEAYSSAGVVQKAVREIKRAVPDLVVITDVCLCEYTDHGHCGVIKEGEVDNDATVALLERTAVSHAEAGAEIVAPSDMMDGRVGAIRSALDDAGFADVAIMSYAAKFCSAFYGPFREAAESSPAFGDRKSYQMAPPNRREALREVELDIAEGADIVMVKPALPYLDIISEVRAAFSVPLAAYNVSGEFAMVKAAARLGWLEEKKAVFEVLIAIKRAGADIIISYFAKDMAHWLAKGEDPFV